MDYSLETLALMWLSSADMLTPKGRTALIAYYGSAQKAYAGFSSAARPLVSGKAYAALQSAKENGLLGIARRLSRLNARVTARGEADYPFRLLPLDDAPELLYYRGELPTGPAVAIVGSRHDTRYGRSQAFSIAKDLALSGVTVVSGLARGIDTAAHQGALAGGGRTVAVLGCGLETTYPPENATLAENIIRSGGALVTEYAPETAPLPFHFPHRNRIISGLSDALLLVEATLKSGTNSTVNHALNQGIPVFALPGNVDAPGSELPLLLLKQGALMATEAKDILNELKIPLKGQAAPAADAAEAADDPVLRALRREEKTFEELSAETGMTPADLSSALSMLELEGKIEKRAGRAYALCLHP